MDVLKKEQERIARVYYQTKLEEIVGPFDARITFRTTSDESNGNYTTNISPTDQTATLNAAGDIVTSIDLFRWLDEGTKERWVSMPEDFRNETTPNSLGTQHADYEKDNIFFLNEPETGIEARNFLEQIDNLYRNLYRIQMSLKIQTYIEKL